MAIDNTGQPDDGSHRDPYEPRIRTGTYLDRRHGGMERKADGGMEYRDRYNPYGRKAQQEYPGYSTQGDRPYYGRSTGYEGHVDVDPELFRQLVRKVRQLEQDRNGMERKNAPRVQHYVINPR